MAIYSNVNIWQGHRSVAELEKIRRAAAKAANQRMVRLERGKSNITGEALDGYGVIQQTREYLIRQKLSQGKGGKLRFSESLHQKNMTVNDLKKEIAELQYFLGAKSSTVKGMHDIEKARIQTFDKKGIKFASNKQFYDFINSDVYFKMLKAFSSDVVQEIYDTARSKDEKGKVLEHDDVLKAMEEYISNNSNVNIKGLMEKLGIKELKRE